MSTMGSFTYLFSCAILTFFAYFQVAFSINREMFQTAEDRQAHLFALSYGCTNLKELRPQELLSHRSHTPKCGCGYYAVRLHDNDLRQDLYNVTVTTQSGRQLRFECIQCDLCVGLKVTSVCKPKQNTVCSEECADPCETYISVLKKCGYDNDKCRDASATTDTVVSTEKPQPPRPHVIQDPPHPFTKDPISEKRSQQIDYQSWLIVAAVVISACVIAVIIIIIAILCKQNNVYQNSHKSNGGSESSDNLLPSTSQTPSKAGPAPV